MMINSTTTRKSSTLVEDENGPMLSASTTAIPGYNPFQHQPSQGFYPPAYGSTYPQHPVLFYPPHHGSSYPPPQATHSPIHTIHSMHTRHPKCIHRPWLRTITLRPESSRSGANIRQEKCPAPYPFFCIYALYTIPLHASSDFECITNDETPHHSTPTREFKP